MRPLPRPTRARALLRCALAVGLSACLAQAGCGESDPVAAVRQQQEAGDFQGSLEPLRKLLAVNPDDPELNFLYGRALAITEGPGLATWSLRKAMQDPEWLVPAGLALAFSALDAYNFSVVDEVTGLVLEQEPENTTALLMRASAHAHWRKNPEQALTDADRVLELDPEVVEAYEPRILALLALGRIEEARESLAEAGRRLEEREAAPDRLAWHCTTTAALQRDAGDIEGARKKWAECLETYPTNAEVVSDAVTFHDQHGERERSLEILRAAFAAVPDSRVFRTALAARLRVSGEAAEGEALLREATEVEEPAAAAAAWMDLAEFRQAMREHEAAAEALGRALELAKQGGTPSPQLAFQYADALVLAGRLDRALEVAEELSLPAHQHLIRARVAQERHDPARALQEFDAGLLLWPDNPWARYQAATAAEELGDFDRALEEFRQSIRISPDATDARIRGATLLLAEGKPRKAIELLHAGDAKAALGPEAKLLSVRLSALLGNMSAVRATLEQLNAVHPTWVGRGLAEAADSLALRGGPKVALGMLASAPMVDYKEPVYAEALHALVRYAHEAGQPESVRSVLEESLAAHPDSSVFLEVRGLDLELSGRSDAALEAYQRAVDLEPGNAFALAGLARLALREEDTAAAVELFDRAAAADTRDPDPMLAAARALAASGDTDQAAARLDKLLRLHPYETDAALERARLDLEQGVATGRTLERAQRAVRFRGGPEALELLSRVYAQRGEEELSAQAAERARELREARAEG